MGIYFYPDRFWAKADRSGGDNSCWPWQAFRNEDGYGTFTRHHARPMKAHRLAYEIAVGPIPDGLQIDHLCRNKACINPAHLEPVTQVENMRRRRWSHCKWGHPFDEVNTYTSPAGGRGCRICRHERAEQSNARRRARGRAA